MKQGVLVCMCLVLMMLFCVPVFAQPSTKSVETIVLDNFDTQDNEWTWKVQASRFVYVETDDDGNETDRYPKTGYFDGVPNSLRPFVGEDEQPKVFGVQVKYDRKGDNWFELYPTTTDDAGEEKNYEFPFRGHVNQLDFWVWGANYVYTLEVLLRDADGRVHTLKAGLLNFNGWKNFVVTIPTYIRQESRLRSGPKNMTFVGFRVRTSPAEYVDDFVIYFDNLKYSTYTLDNVFDGYDLKSADFNSANEGAE